MSESGIWILSSTSDIFWGRLR